MKILVPIKQVPESSNVKMDPETGTVIRTGIETVVNPLDLYALEAALTIKGQLDGTTVIALSMGPPQAMKVLKEAVAMGCDDAVLISDRKFGGADTWATSYTISEAIKKTGDFDLIICGERATDGDTAQVGPGIAAWLDLPLATYVSRIDGIENERIYVERMVEEGYQLLSLPFPCLLTVVKEVATPRLPTLRGKIRAREMTIPVYSGDNMELNPDYLGLKGSPTRVVKIDTPKVTRGGKIVQVKDELSLRHALDELFSFLGEKGIL